MPTGDRVSGPTNIYEVTILLRIFIYLSSHLKYSMQVELLNIIRKPAVLDAVGKQAVLDSFDVEVPTRRSTKKKGGKKK